MVHAALFTAVICAVAPFSIKIGPIPLTFATLVIYIAAGSLGWKFGAASVALYVVLGAIGLPVFANFEGGFHKIAGVTGGFIIGYLPCALAAGLGADVGNKLWSYISGLITGTLLLYTCGTAWFIYQTGATLPASLTMCVTPFLIGDTIKIVFAVIVTPKLRKALAVNRGAVQKDSVKHEQ